MIKFDKVSLNSIVNFWNLHLAFQSDII